MGKRYDLRATVLSHGWVKLAPFSWNDEKSMLSRVENIDGIGYHCHVAQHDSKS